jgi:hypothetical protein
VILGSQLERICKRNREHMKAVRLEAHNARWDARDKIRVPCAEYGLEMFASGF